MQAKNLSRAGIRRGLVQLLIVACGFVTLLGSGGGGGSALICFDWCGTPNALPPNATIVPQRTIVQLGASATFSVNVISMAPSDSIRIQWCRKPKDAASCTQIAGATGRALTWPNAKLADDETQFQATVNDGFGTVEASGVLYVTQVPGLVFSDKDFVDANWSVNEVLDPAQSGATHTESRSTTGGNPDAFRSVSYVMPQAESTVSLFHTWLSGTYDPATQGAVFLMDFTLDCAKVSAEETSLDPSVRPMIEQGGRRFIPLFKNYAWSWSCYTAQWETLAQKSSVSVNDFILTDGPACGASDACPDFSAQAAPLRFGFVTSASVGSRPGSIVQGIDNWKVTVWRK